MWLLFQPVPLGPAGLHYCGKPLLADLTATSIMPDAGSPLAGLACYMWHAHAIGLLPIAIDCQTKSDYVNAMTDKEVGELWHFYNEYNPGEEKGKQIRALIRKLVEERTNIIGCLHREGYRDVPLREDRRGWVNYDTEALKDFGIDPKTWKEST